MARPTSVMRNRPAPPRASVPVHPMVRGLSGPAVPVRVEFDVRTAYDFLISLSQDCEANDIPAEDRRWLDEARRSLALEVPDSPVCGGLEFAFQTNLGALVVDMPGVRTAAELVAAVEAASPTVLARAVFCEELQDAALRPSLERALAGDVGILTELGPKLGDWHTEERLEILRQPAAFQRETVTVLRAWERHFRGIEDRVAAMLRRDMDGRAGDIATLGPAALIEKTTGGVRWLSEPGVRRIVLAPSYFSRPYNFLMSGDDWRFFAYPIADAALDAADPLAPPPAVVRLHRALGDETRLRILRLLADRDWYLTELATQLELSKPTIKHHLAQLRAAGLVTITEEGVLIYYSLRRQRLDEAGRELAGFLGS